MYLSINKKKQKSTKFHLLVNFIEQKFEKMSRVKFVKNREMTVNFREMTAKFVNAKKTGKTKNVNTCERA